MTASAARTRWRPPFATTVWEYIQYKAIFSILFWAFLTPSRQKKICHTKIRPIVILNFTPGIGLTCCYSFYSKNMRVMSHKLIFRALCIFWSSRKKVKNTLKIRVRFSFLEKQVCMYFCTFFEQHWYKIYSGWDSSYHEKFFVYNFYFLEKSK